MVFPEIEFKKFVKPKLKSARICRNEDDKLAVSQTTETPTLEEAAHWGFVEAEKQVRERDVKLRGILEYLAGLVKDDKQFDATQQGLKLLGEKNEG